MKPKKIYILKANLDFLSYTFKIKKFKESEKWDEHLNTEELQKKQDGTR